MISNDSREALTLAEPVQVHPIQDDGLDIQTWFVCARTASGDNQIYPHTFSRNAEAAEFAAKVTARGRVSPGVWRAL